MVEYSKYFADPECENSVDPLDLISTAESISEIDNICDSICTVEGFSHYAIIERPQKQISTWEDVSVLTNWPSAMVDDYNHLNLIDGSPILAHLEKSTRPLVFDVNRLNQNRTDGKSKSAVAFLKRNGIDVGVLLSAHLANGRIGGVLFCNGGSSPSRAQVVRLHYMANMLFAQAYNLAGHSDQESKLTEIELKGLQLLLNGKTGSEISAAMNLSAFTVHRCFDSAVKKLGTKTLHEAIGKALQLRLIT